MNSSSTIVAGKGDRQNLHFMFPQQIYRKYKIIFLIDQRHSSVLGLDDAITKLNKCDGKIHPLISIRPHVNRTVSLEAAQTNLSINPAHNELGRIILYDAGATDRSTYKNQRDIEIVAPPSRQLDELEYPHIVFLGTSAATQSHSRSNAAILVNLR